MGKRTEATPPPPTHMPHNYLVAFFLYIALPAPMISLLMSMFQAPLIFQVGRGVVCSVLVPYLQHIHTCHVLCARPVVVHPPPPPPAQTFPLLSKVFDAIRVYGYIVGLKINPDKSAFLTKGMWQEHDLHRLSQFGVCVRQKVKYLGILLGHVSSDEAYAPVIARAAMRAAFMLSLPLTFTERTTLLQEWVLPLFIFPARAYFPTATVVPQVAAIYRTALWVSSWGLTLPILELSKTTEGPMKTPGGPMKTTEGRMKTTEGPMKTTEGPMKTTEGPMKTTEGPMKTNERPMKTTEGPMKFTEGQSTRQVSPQPPPPPRHAAPYLLSPPYNSGDEQWMRHSTERRLMCICM